MDLLRVIGLGLLTAAWCFAASPAVAEKRVALVIGNSAYQKVARLPNPVNDATSMTGMFKAAGFDLVETKFDLGANDLRRTLRDFGAKSRDADVAVIYYAGHGIELDGTNYLIPVDAALETDTDVLDEAIPLDRVLYAVESAKQLRLVILDACRNNPFAETMKRTMASRAIGRGLARIEPTSPNTLIAFAAKAGSTTSDGDSKNSPFAAALVEHLPKPGLDLRRAFGFVRDDVLKNTGNKQEPFVYGSLGGNDLPLVPASHVTASPQSDPQSAVRHDYELALQLGSRYGWQAFLAQYPEGFYANLAKGQLDKIAAAESAKQERVPAAEPAQLPAAKAADETTQSRPKSDSATALAPDQSGGKSQADAARTPAEKRKLQRAQPASATRKPEESTSKRSVASAEATSTPSAGSRTCSQTRDQCRIDRRILGPASVAKCDPFYAQCMKTGVWHSGFNHFVGVLRR
jgi:hypothetical protein